MIQQSHYWAYIWKKKKTLIWKDIGTPIFIAALFTIAKTWKQAKCPSTDNWLKTYTHTHTHTHTHTLEYYLTIKKNQLVPFAAAWMDLKNIIQNIILGEMSDRERQIP